MIATIGTELVRKLTNRDLDIHDRKLCRFVLRCRANGQHSYRVVLSKHNVATIGRVGVLTPAEAREEATRQLAEFALGRNPNAAKKAARAMATVRVFLKDHYEPYAIEHFKRGKETVQRLRVVFAALLDEKLSDVTLWTFEKWRTARLKIPHSKPATVNSHLTMLKSMLAKAVMWKLLPEHPLRGVKPLKTDKMGRVRYLSPNEETRLRDALVVRDAARKARREHANAWRRSRGYDEWSTDQTDHLTPIVLLALNTGMRKGEIFNLRWTDVDLVAASLTVRGEGAKSAQTRYLPLNAEALSVLRMWHATAEDPGGHVFPGRKDGDPLDDVKKAWLPLIKAANISSFTFHDLRHTFASKLVMRGVDLNTVRELLGHADLKMTLRYAHLAPEHKSAAVAKLLAG